ncbi:MAG: hypothetical protein EXR67_03035 [Dehalococcoidia bacterium]|nr:hypothetical protein [Dehalococcoidia bacterium]
MKFLVIHETRFELVLEAASERDAERRAADTPYDQWDRALTVREEIIPIEEDPRNPHAGG